MVREAAVGESRERDFAKVFGQEGIWSEFLRQSGEYLETGWKLESEAERRYRVMDSWRSHKGFEQFRERHQLEYEKFSQLILLDGLVERETVLGSFYEHRPDDENGLVSSKS